METLRALALLLFIIAAMTVSCSETVRWQKNVRYLEFLKRNNCQMIGEARSQAEEVLGPNGKVSMGSSRVKVGHLCDDGVIYWR